jgi:hypothetical protein
MVCPELCPAHKEQYRKAADDSSLLSSINIASRSMFGDSLQQLKSKCPDCHHVTPEFWQKGQRLRDLVQDLALGTLAPTFGCGVHSPCYIAKR